MFSFHKVKEASKKEEEEGKQEEDGVGQLPAGVFKLEQQKKKSRTVT